MLKKAKEQETYFSTREEKFWCLQAAMSSIYLLYKHQ